MIKHFSSLYVGHIELDNVGANGTSPEDRLYPNERLTECFGMAEAIAKQLDSQGYYALWMAEHHFQREGYECIPKSIDAQHVPLDTDETSQVRVRVQHRANVASVAFGRGLRDGGHTVGGTCDIRGGSGVPTPGKWRPSVPRCRTMTPTKSCSWSRWRLSSRRSTRSRSPTRANTTICRPRCHTGDTT